MLILRCECQLPQSRLCFRPRRFIIFIVIIVAFFYSCATLAMPIALPHSFFFFHFPVQISQQQSAYDCLRSFGHSCFFLDLTCLYVCVYARALVSVCVVVCLC
jgi:hypothetical protein